MLSISKRLKVLQTLGELLNEFTGNLSRELDPAGTSGFPELDIAIERSKSNNPWFTHESIMLSLKGLANMLELNKIEAWANNYSIGNNHQSKTIGVVMAGNIPLVGFHDFVCVFLSGHRFLGKLSADDPYLFPAILKILSTHEPCIQEYFQFTTDRITDFDAIIATGSNNTARYFDFYFGKYPNIIRKNRNSLAILDGDETQEDLRALSDDIFTFFGLGCRNVSKILIPEDFPVSTLLESFGKYASYAFNHKYFNNYEYNKAILLINQVPHYDNGFSLLVPQTSLSSPVSVIHYQTYRHAYETDDLVLPYLNEIQCIVSKSGRYENSVIPGQAQFPELNDYADGVDTMEFLLKLP